MSVPIAPLEPATSSSVATLWNKRLAWIVLLLVIVALIAGNLYWLQWAGQTGITLGYPKPTVKIASLASSTLTLYKATTFKAQGNGRDLKYTWNFGDTSSSGGFGGGPGSSTPSNQPVNGGYHGQEISYQYQTNGNHIISVTVIDPLGQTSNDAISVQVLPPPPTASFTAQTSTSYWFYDQVSFDASLSAADPSTHIASYTWDFGDNSRPETDTYSSSTYHYYQQDGTYTVTLTVTDELGQSATYSNKVTVAKPASN
ncbi:PKD domain-containing protein [Tengunoibacter tsumagoiensis]|uniref:PKD domain-containing protein n=1 Tax=Tengunoibacter tsumagoiensis TaxID=2014871 RepID=A0A401ZUG5_9CHLR|nr:PKD domain-containing protein [Tengunoibacter tsumagoiensis]GCE10513.1 hypothetical protein KTT_03720 [Tengunoibacter tsumagoiensis]